MRKKRVEMFARRLGQVIEKRAAGLAGPLEEECLPRRECVRASAGHHFSVFPQSPSPERPSNVWQEAGASMCRVEVVEKDAMSVLSSEPGSHQRVNNGHLTCLDVQRKQCSHN